MQEGDWIWFDGKFVPWKEAEIHVLTHGLNYGTSIFEGIRAYETEDNSAVFRLDEHVDRFFESAVVAQLDLDVTRREVKDAIVETVAKNGLGDCYIRPIAWMSYGNLGVHAEVPVSFAVAAYPWGAYLGERVISEGAKAKIVSYIRPHPDSYPSGAKIGGSYFLSRLASNEARDEGYDEAIMLNHQGWVGEGSGENIFAVKDEVLYTPPFEANILPGITRKSLLQVGEDKGYETEEKLFKPKFLFDADEVFFCGTAVEVVGVVQIDDREVGDGTVGPITTEMRETYMDIVRGRREEYASWLTPVYETGDFPKRAVGVEVGE